MKILLHFVLAVSMACAAPACAAQMFPPQFRDIAIEPRVGAQLPLDSAFRDQSGAAVHLGDYFRDKPVLLMPVYYTCTTLCGEALRGLVEGIGTLHIVPGRDFEIVAFSINPAEQPADAMKKLVECTMNYNGKRGGPGWHFLTGSVGSIKAVTQAVGFHYRYDPQHQMYVHASGMIIATPAGRVSRYLFGVAYQPGDLQQALAGAGRNQLAVSTQALRLLCYPFAAGTGKFNTITILAVRLAAILMLIGMLAGLIALWRFDVRRHRRAAASEAAS